MHVVENTKELNWINDFMEYTDGIPSPEIYRLWTAHTIIAGALERRCWTRLTGRPVYPNLITLLIGPPGSGKTQAIREARDLWAACGRSNIAPSGMTKAAFVDQLRIKLRTVEYDGKILAYNPMLVAATEFGTLLPEYDLRFLNVINDVYDCLPIFDDMTRGGDKKITIRNPHVCILSGTQPTYLGKIMPEAAYGMGFMSRLLMIYHGERVVVELFDKKPRTVALRGSLIDGLKKIHQMVGEFEWDDDAKIAAETWNRNLFADAPKHSRLQDYANRRIIHVIKLAMSVSVAKGNYLHVTLQDFMIARKMLLDAERLMPEIFKDMRSSDDSHETEEIHAFAFSYCRHNEVKGIPEHVLVAYMLKSIPVHRVTFFINAMLTAQLLESIGLNLEGKRTLAPLAKVNVEPKKKK